MVNPAYPPQMQMPPGQGPGRPGMPGPGMPMGMGPGPGIPQANMTRRGTPKAVPIVVSAGLAIGVFCGLYFGLGTGEKPAEAQAASAKTGDNVPPSAAPATNETTNFKSAPIDPSTGKPAVDPTAVPGTDPAAAGTPPTPGTDPAAAGTPTPPTPPTPAAPAEVSVELTFEVTPPEATVTIDDEPVTGGKATIKFTGDEKTFRVVGKASGFKSYDKKVTIAKDATAQTIEVKLSKKSSGGGTRPPKGNDREPPGGLIDL